MFLAITDSGLGGLAICAAIERDLRERPRIAPVRLTYINAWPEEGRGYNDFPDMSSRAAMFNRALIRMSEMGPDRLLIACNTLSIVYPLTEFSRSASVPVLGIVDAGVRVFREALDEAPRASIVLLGTRTTIASDVHRDHLVAAGVDAGRIVGVSCHGLATAIERDGRGPDVGRLIAECARAVAGVRPAGESVFVGLCCTHYGYVADRICSALAHTLRRPVAALDPNVRMVQDVTRSGLIPELTSVGGVRSGSRGADGPSGIVGRVDVDVVSKVVLDERTREGVASLVGPVSPATAAALRSYVHAPGLF